MVEARVVAEAQPAVAEPQAELWALFQAQEELPAELQARPVQEAAVRLAAEELLVAEAQQQVVLLPEAVDQ